MLNIAYGILTGSLLAVLYVPIFFISYKKYFYAFDKNKLKHIANRVVSTVVYTEYMKYNLDNSYYINYCDYYYKGKLYTYKYKSDKLLKINSNIDLYFISNPNKAQVLKDVGGKEYTPLLKLYIISWIYSVILSMGIYLFKINLGNNIFLFLILTVVSQLLTWISYYGIYCVMNFIKKVVYSENIVEVEAKLVSKGKEGVVSTYIYNYEYNNKIYKYKLKSNGNESETIKLYFEGNPKKVYEKDIVGTIYSSNWGKIFSIFWLILSLVLLGIFIR